MRLLVLVLSMVFIFSCTQETCNIGNTYALKYSKGLSERWKCNNDKVYKDMLSVLNASLCKNTPIVKSLYERAAVASLACEAVVTALGKFGGMYLESRWECNADLVSTDIKKIGAICSILGLI
jgi:hypothetical protein